MPIALSHLPADRLVVLQLHNDIDPREVVDTARAYMAQPDRDMAVDVLIDLSLGPDFKMTFVDMMSMVEQLAPMRSFRLPGTKTAIVAPDDLNFGMARMYHSLVTNSGPHEMAIFRETEPALAYLGHGPDLIGRLGLLR